VNRRRLLQSLAALVSAPAWGVSAAGASTFPGGVARIRLGKGDSPPRVRLGADPVLVMREGDEWVAVVGVPLSAKPGSKLRVQAEGKQFEVAVEPRAYGTIRLKVAPGQVDLSAEDLARYKREREHLDAVLRTFSDGAPATLSMLHPVRGRFAAPFGLQRYFNDQLRSRHSGLDIAAPEGTPIVAAIAGRVIDTTDYFFNGRTVVLDHGQGLLTLYAHMHTVEVASADTVEAGRRIGTVGATGRATGPHLHFSVYLNAVAVDPALFLVEGK
jgi:murein DD-endopeptidase MepM/ murein hydrolase activator NlpD